MYLDELHEECFSPERVLLKMESPPYVHISQSVVTCISNSAKHQATLECQRFTIVRDREVRAERQVEVLEVHFTIGDVKINHMKQFWYLGRVLDENDDNSHAAGRQLARARDKWKHFGHVFKSKRVSP